VRRGEAPARQFSDFEDMFDFDSSPSLNAAFSVAAPLPQQPPAVVPGDNGCPFTP
jgi:hypothetical protein